MYGSGQTAPRSDVEALSVPQDLKSYGLADKVGSMHIVFPYDYDSVVSPSILECLL